jgi:hypothetical protein
MEAARFQDEQKVALANDDTVFMAKSALNASNTDTMQASAVGATPPQPKELGEEIIVVSTYDGEWHPTDGAKK